MKRGFLLKIYTTRGVKLKKLLKMLPAAILAVVMMFGLVSCKRPELKIIMPDGAPFLSLANMRENVSEIKTDKKKYKTAYDTALSPDALKASLLNGSADFAVAPINVCAEVYNKGGNNKYLFAGVGLSGILHIVSNQTGINGLEDLKGKTVAAFAQGNTPGITLRAVLKLNGIDSAEMDTFENTNPDQVGIIYYSDASAIRNEMIKEGSSIKYALLAEPVVTAVASSGFKPVISIQDEWAAHYGEAFPQAGFVFKASLLEKDSELVEKLIAHAAASVLWAFENPFDAGELAKKQGSTLSGKPVEVAVNGGRLPLEFKAAKDCKASVLAYLEAIYDENANLVGGAVPDDGFFYGL